MRRIGVPWGGLGCWLVGYRLEGTFLQVYYILCRRLVELVVYAVVDGLTAVQK